MFVRLYNTVEVQANRCVPFKCRSCDTENKVYSLERIRDYIQIEHEPSPSEDGKPPAYWPASGELHVEHLSARYSLDGPVVLKDISFNIKSGERVGVGKL